MLSHLTSISTISQDMNHYLPETVHFPKINTEANIENHLQHYFSPWKKEHLISSTEKIQQILHQVIQQHTTHPGYSLTRQKHSSDWIKQIAENADLAHFPTLSEFGIVLFHTEARLLPTLAPTFKDIYSEWHGYPFDDMQQSYLTAGTPVLILHVSKDHAWMLILTGSFWGWVQSHTIAFTTPEFMQTYQTKSYVVPCQDHILASQNITQLSLAFRIGMLLPIQKISEDYFSVYVPKVDLQRNAVMDVQKVDKKELTLFPYLLSAVHIAKIGNHMMGMPYGWGGLCGFRDCSSTLADLMSTFGIWLPRNSKDQIQAGPSISVKSMNSAEKLKFLREHAIPFLTLLYAPGHIVLYLGERDGIAYVFHSTFRLYGTVITPLDVKLKEERRETLLEEIELISLLPLVGEGRG